MAQGVLHGLPSPVCRLLVRFSVEEETRCCCQRLQREHCLRSNGDAFVSCRSGLVPVLCSEALFWFPVIGNAVFWPRLSQFSSKKHVSNSS